MDLLDELKKKLQGSDDDVLDYIKGLCSSPVNKVLSSEAIVNSYRISVSDKKL